MVKVKGLRGLRFAPEQTGSLDNVVTPPYDVISTAMREEMGASSPYNMTHLMLPEAAEGLTKYEAANKLFTDLRAQGILKADTEESIYLIEQEFTDLTGVTRVRRAFFALAKLPEPGEKIILGHERTFDGPVQDRLQLMEATRADMEPIFGLYTDPDNVIDSLLTPIYQQPPQATANTVDGVQVRIWQAPFPTEVASFLSDKKIYIADGHHRFQTACHYRDMQRKVEGQGELKTYDHILVGFVAFTDPGVAIYPPHRLVDFPPDFNLDVLLTALEPWFDITQVHAEDLTKSIQTDTECKIGLLVHQGGAYALSLRTDIDRADMLGTDHGPSWRDLDVAVLHRGILEKILQLPEGVVLEYEKDLSAAFHSVATGRKGLAFILNSTRADQIRACAEDAEAMPQKSTYFFPKLPSGVVIYPFA